MTCRRDFCQLSGQPGGNQILAIASCRAFLTTLLKTEACQPPLPRSTPEEAAYLSQRLPNCFAASERPGGRSGRQGSERRMLGRRWRSKARHGHGRSRGGNRTQSRHGLSGRLRRGRSRFIIVPTFEVRRHQLVSDHLEELGNAQLVHAGSMIVGLVPQCLVEALGKPNRNDPSRLVRDLLSPIFFTQFSSASAESQRTRRSSRISTSAHTR